MSLTSIQQEIVHLSSIERARLIDILWESLDEEPISEIEAKWAAESEERIDAVDRGELQTVDGSFALQDLRSSLRKRRPSVTLQVCRCGNELFPIRQVAFGHNGSKSDIAARMDQTSEVRQPEGSARRSRCGSRQHREATSSHQADRER